MERKEEIIEAKETEQTIATCGGGTAVVVPSEESLTDDFVDDSSEEFLNVLELNHMIKPYIFPRNLLSFEEVYTGSADAKTARLQCIEEELAKSIDIANQYIESELDGIVPGIIESSTIRIWEEDHPEKSGSYLFDIFQELQSINFDHSSSPKEGDVWTKIVELSSNFYNALFKAVADAEAGKVVFKGLAIEYGRYVVIN